MKYIRQKKTNICSSPICRIYKIKQTKEYNNNSKKNQTHRYRGIKLVIISGETEPRKGYEITYEITIVRFPVAQWSGICLPMQKTCVQSLLWKIPHAVMQPFVPHDLSPAAAQEAQPLSTTPRLLRPTHLTAVIATSSL